MRQRAACFVACLVVLGFGDAASGVVTSQVVTGSILGNAGGAGLLPPDCPPGTTALGAGLDSDNPSVLSVVEIGPNFFGVTFDDHDPGSYPATERFGIFSNDGDNPHPIAVATLCREGERTIEIETLTADPHQVGAARVLCPAGDVAVGGGASFTPNGPITSSGPVLDDGTPDGARLIDYATGAAPAPIGWRATLRNGGDLILSERAAAVCDAGVAIIATRVATSTVPEAGTASNRVLCAAGEIALGGGVDVTDTGDMVVTASAPVFDNGSPSGQRLINRSDGTHPAPIGWLGAARNEGTIAHTLVIGVICPEPRGGAAVTVCFAALAALARRARREAGVVARDQ